MKSNALMLAGQTIPEFRLQTLDIMAVGYATDGPFEYGALFGEATYRLACELVETVGLGAGRKVFLQSAGRGALNWADSLLKLGNQQQAIKVISESISWLRLQQDTDNLP